MICVILICFFNIVHIVKYVFSLSVSFVKNNNFWRLVLLFCQFQNILSVHHHDIILSFSFLLLMTHKSILEIIVVLSQFSFQNVFWSFLLFFLWICLVRFFSWFVHSEILQFWWFSSVCILVIFLDLLVTLSVLSLQFLFWQNLIFYSRYLLNCCFFSCSIEWWSHILLEFLLIMLVIHSIFLLSWSIADFYDLIWWLSDILLLADMFFIISTFSLLLTFLYHEHHIIVL